MASDIVRIEPTWDRSIFEPALESALDAVIITTADLDAPGPLIVYANPAFCRLTGYEREELIGNSPRVLQGPRTDRFVLRRLRAALDLRELFMGSTINYRKDGTTYTVEWSVTPVRDVNEGKDYFVSIQRPVDPLEVRISYLEALVGAAPLGFLLVDDAGCIRIANRMIGEIFGYSPEELVDLPVERLVPEERQAHHATLRQSFSRSPVSRQMEGRDLEGLRKDGSRIAIEVGLSSVNLNGIACTLASVIDITDRQEQQRRLGQRSKQQIDLVAFGQWALEAPDLSELQQGAAELLASSVGFDAVVIVARSHDSNEGRVVGAAGLSTDEWPSSMPITSALNDMALIPRGQNGQSATSPTDLGLEQMLPGVERFPSCTCIPVADATQSFAFIVAFKHAFSALDDDAYELAQTAAQILASATRHEQDRRRVEEAEHLRLVAGRVAQLGGWAVVLAEGRVRWSQQVAAIHDLPGKRGVSLDEAHAFYAPEHQKRLRKVFAACAENGTPFDEEMAIITAAGRRRIVRTMGEAIVNSGGIVTEVRGAFQDITSQRGLENRVWESERYFRQLGDAMPGIVWTAEPDGTLDYVNRRLADYIGTTNDSFRQDSLIAAMHPDDRERCMVAWQDAVDSATPYAIDYRLYDQTYDEYRWHYVSAEPVLDEAGRVGKWYGSALDIHERKVLEEELVSSAGRLTATLESITDGFYTVDAAWRVTYFNNEAERLLLVTRDEVLGRSLWEAFPDAVGTSIEREYRLALNEQIAREFEYYFPPLERWFEVHAYPADDRLTVYFRDITARKRTDARAHFLAYHDPLTGLPNRESLTLQLEQAAHSASASEAHAALLLIDMDDFKTLNDTRGHKTGDAVLKEIAARLRRAAPEADMVARIGGDEFAILLPQSHDSAIDNASAAQLLGWTIRDHLTEAYLVEGARHLRTCGVGIALFTPGDHDAEEILQRADLALNYAKRQGRGSVALFDPMLQDSMNRRAWLENRLPDALESNQFIAHFQPWVASNGRCIGAEALVRWHDPDWGMISPGEFIPVAEHVGLISDLGQVVLRQACEQLVRWSNDPTLSELTVSVNVSVRQFRDTGFVDSVEAILRETGANPHHLKMEVTESLLDQDIGQTIERMNTLRALGITFALDDFGTGYSSLAYLRRLPFNILKIDQSFVRDMLTASSDAAIVQTIIALAGSLGLDVLAEGVETQEVRDALVQQGCHEFQGYLFSPAVKAEAFEVFAREHAG